MEPKESKTFIGGQELLREEKLENGLVKAILKIDKEKNQMTSLEEEAVLFTEESLNLLKSYEKPDLTKQRRDVCRKAIQDIINVFKDNAIPEKDIEYVFQMVVSNLGIAKDRYFEKHAGKTTDKFTVSDLADELEHL